MENVSLDPFQNLHKVHGEKLVNFEIIDFEDNNDNKNQLKQFILTFEDTDKIDIKDTFKIAINARNIKTERYIEELENPKHKSTELDGFIGKRLVDVSDLHLDTTFGPIDHLSLDFERWLLYSFL